MAKRKHEPQKVAREAPKNPALRIVGSREQYPWEASNRKPTISQIKKLFGPAKTLGGPAGEQEELRLAQDAALEMCGAYSLIQHAFSMGQGMGPQFMGYAGLSSLSQNGLVKACINTVADAMTREWITLTHGKNKDQGDETFIALTTAINKTYELQEIFHQAAIYTGFFGGCLIYMDTGCRGADLEKPLDLSDKSAELRNGGLKRFVPIEPINIFPGDYNSINPLSPDYFRPTYWWVMAQKVHASRFIRIVSDEPPILLRPAYNFFGIPHAQVLYDYVLHFQECRVAVQRLLTKFSRTVFKTQMMELFTQEDGLTQLDRRLQIMVDKQDNDGITAVDKESEDIVNVVTPISGIVDIPKQALEFVTAINMTPAVQLLGISPSGFNATGESDIRIFDDRILSKNEKEQRHGIATAIQAVQVSTLGRIDPDISFDFNPLGKDDELAKANIQKVKADTDAVLIQAGEIEPGEGRQRLVDDPDSGYGHIDPEQVPQAPESGEMDDSEEASGSEAGVPPQDAKSKLFQGLKSLLGMKGAA